jgi:hypothetical protein
VTETHEFIFRPGDWVIWIPTGEQGRVKELSEVWVWVVFHCNGDWENFQAYDAAACARDNLKKA